MGMGKKGRRGNGEGNIYQRKDGRWCGRYFVELPDGSKKRMTIYGKSRKEVDKKLRQAMAERDKGLVYDDQNLTLSEYLERWLEDSVKSSVAPRTFHNYRLQVCRHIIPILGKLKLKALKPHHVQRLYRDKLDSGLSPTSVRYIHAVLRRALNQATRWTCVPHNATEDVDLPKVAPKKGEALKSSEAKRLLDAARGDRLEALYVLAVSCGLRQGELLALRWSDLDLEAGTLHVSRQIQRMRDGSGLAFLPLKNCKSDSESERTVILGPRAIKALRRHRQRQSEEKLMLADAYKDQGLIFATYKGTPLEASNLAKRSYKPLLKRAGLPKIRFHDLRHTCATLMAHQGVSPRVAQDRLGHADISMTMGIYTHVTPDAQTQAARAIEDALA